MLPPPPSFSYLIRGSPPPPHLRRGRRLRSPFLFFFLFAVGRFCFLFPPPPPETHFPSIFLPSPPEKNASSLHVRCHRGKRCDDAVSGGLGVEGGGGGGSAVMMSSTPPECSWHGGHSCQQQASRRCSSNSSNLAAIFTPRPFGEARTRATARLRTGQQHHLSSSGCLVKASQKGEEVRSATTVRLDMMQNSPEEEDVPGDPWKTVNPQKHLMRKEEEEEASIVAKSPTEVPLPIQNDPSSLSSFHRLLSNLSERELEIVNSLSLLSANLGLLASQQQQQQQQIGGVGVGSNLDRPRHRGPLVLPHQQQQQQILNWQQHFKKEQQHRQQPLSWQQRDKIDRRQQPPPLNWQQQIIEQKHRQDLCPGLARVGRVQDSPKRKTVHCATAPPTFTQPVFPAADKNNNNRSLGDFHGVRLGRSSLYARSSGGSRRKSRRGRNTQSSLSSLAGSKG